MSGLISAGELNRLVTFEALSQSRNEDTGQFIDQWSLVKVVWAKIMGLTGRELIAAQAKQLAVTHRVTVRFDAVFEQPLTVATYRMRYNGRIFACSASINFDEDNRVVDIDVSEGLNNGQ